jgi:AmmeMemoRadiSam system protein B
MKREMSVAGSFYPKEPEEVLRYFDHFNKILEENSIELTQKSKAVVVPHAGYVYSGFSANMSYQVLKNANIETIAVIGPSHRVGFNGISLGNFESYDTPFGTITSSSTLQRELKNKFSLPFFPKAHMEHSTETQFPFIKHYIPNASIVELVYSNAQSEELEKIIEYTLSLENTAVVISTDLSHFYSLDEANKLDSYCLKAMQNVNPQALQECEACGKRGLSALLLYAQKNNLSTKVLDYRTSADASHDKSRVVGYMSACLNFV